MSYEEKESIAKKTLMCITAFTLFLLLLINKTYSFNLLQAATSVFNKKGVFADLLGIDSITGEIFEAFISPIEYVTDGITQLLFDQMILPAFEPNRSTLANFGVGVQITKAISDFSRGFGYILAIIILVISLWKIMFKGNIADTKDNAISLVGRFIIAIFLIQKIDDVQDAIFNGFSLLYKTLTQYDPSNLNPKNLSFVDISKSNINVLGTKFAGSAGGVAIVSVPSVTFIFQIIKIILLFKFFKSFIKMWFELVQRYLISTFFTFLSGGFVGTIVSTDTERIFKSYVQVLMSSYFLLMFDVLWLRICVIFMNSNLTGHVTVGKYCIGLALFEIGPKMDSYLRSMGIGIASGMGNLASSAGGGFRSLLSGLTAANNMRHGAANMLQAAGLATNNAGMYKAGHVLGYGVNDLAQSRSNPLGSLGSLGDSLGSRGQKFTDDDLGISGSAERNRNAGALIEQGLANNTSRFSQNGLNALTSSQLKGGAQELLSGKLGSDVKVDSAKLDKRTDAHGQYVSGVNVSGTYVDEQGLTQKFSGVMRAGEDGIKINDNLSLTTDPMTQGGMNYTFDNSNKQNNGMSPNPSATGSSQPNNSTPISSSGVVNGQQNIGKSTVPLVATGEQVNNGTTLGVTGGLSGNNMQSGVLGGQMNSDISSPVSASSYGNVDTDMNTNDVTMASPLPSSISNEMTMGTAVTSTLRDAGLFDSENGYGEIGYSPYDDSGINGMVTDNGQQIGCIENGNYYEACDRSNTPEVITSRIENRFDKRFEGQGYHDANAEYKGNGTYQVTMMDADDKQVSFTGYDKGFYHNATVNKNGSNNFSMGLNKRDSSVHNTIVFNENTSRGTH